MEESGLTHVKFLSDEPFSIEILSVDGHMKKGHYVSHLHLNVDVSDGGRPGRCCAESPRGK